MSNYRAIALNPKNGEIEYADFLDDYFGQHRYGVRFNDGHTHPERDIVCLSPDECGIAFKGYYMKVIPSDHSYTLVIDSKGILEFETLSSMANTFKKIVLLDKKKTEVDLELKRIYRGEF